MERENKYAEGSVVYAHVAPATGLVIRRYLDRIYFCRLQDDPEREIPYFEREITSDPALVGEGREFFKEL